VVNKDVHHAFKKLFAGLLFARIHIDLRA